MNIFYDARWTKLGTHDGISRYGAELLAALARQHDVTMLICDKRQLQLLPKIPYLLVNNPISVQELFLPLKLNKLKADVVFSPLQIMGIWGRKYKLILTLQDMIYYHNPKPPTHLPAIVRLAWWLFHRAYWPQRCILNQADYIATVSQISKQQIQAAKLTNKPIGVIYNAPPKIAPIKITKTQKELVYMGSFMPYKNVESLILAINLLPDYKLHLSSKITPQRHKELLKLAKNKAQLVFWNGISDTNYAKILSSATALVSASKDEGFGLPIIEALALGVPVACTDMPIFHEVAGEAALFFDPTKPQQIVNCIHQIEDQPTRQQLIKAGQIQAAKYSWNNSAKALLKIMLKI